ncbi:hypothetical protein AXG93_3228s1100 [Marchantia polymorpha subsp. ruderalis]|uniref:Uncharacterized protein n=1 Tax=Marchantia polymorpha subsp. ruderalis TaxID=1480154 RepID=A0A176WIW3_MARPO|nr:hypothetical protein AXG93_3228s1100 [Marchantia polymorpha subsp. ruderalis]
MLDGKQTSSGHAAESRLNVPVFAERGPGHTIPRNQHKSDDDPRACLPAMSKTTDLPTLGKYAVLQKGDGFSAFAVAHVSSCSRNASRRVALNCFSSLRLPHHDPSIVFQSESRNVSSCNPKQSHETGFDLDEAADMAINETSSARGRVALLLLLPFPRQGRFSSDHDTLTSSSSTGIRRHDSNPQPAMSRNRRCDQERGE